MKRRVISIIISMAVLLVSLPTYALGPDESTPTAAQSTSEGGGIAATLTERAEPTVLFEIEEQRKGSEKVFRMSDGSYTSVTYATDVHYASPEGWAEIDNTLSVGEDGIVNAASDVMYTFSDDPDSLPGVEIEYEGYRVSLRGVEQGGTSGSMTLSMTEDSSGYDIQLMSSEGEAQTMTLSETESEGQSELTVEQAAVVESLSDGVLYQSEGSGDSYEYILQGRDLKENIIVSAPRDSYVYNYLLETEGLTAALGEDGSILLCDGEEEVFFIPAPYMTDGAGAYSEEAYYTLQSAGSGVWCITLTASAEWINADDRSFPVVIDPSVVTAKASTTDYDIYTQYITANDTSTKHQGQAEMLVGSNGTYAAYGYVKVNNLPDLPANTRMCDAAVYIALMSYTSYGLDSFDMYVQGALSTWENQFLASGATANSSAVLDYATLSEDAVGFIELDVTETAQQWYEDSTLNYGIVLYSGTAFTSGASAGASFRGFVNSGSAYYCPFFCVRYRNIQGVEPYYTYYTEDAGRAGTVYVSDYTGSMTLVRTDVSDPGYTLQHVYNSNYADRIFNGGSTTSLMHTVDYSNMVVGKGWKLNAQESIIAKGVIGVDDYAMESTVPHLIYTDGDGTEHYFYLSEDEEYTYYDEDGLGLKIVNDVRLNYYTMTDDKDNEKLFVHGYLTKITDSNGNVTAFVYNGASYSSGSAIWYPNSTGNYLSSIVQHNDGKSAYTVATLGYTDSRLTSVSDRYGRTTTYAVSALADDGSGYQLNNLTEADGAISYYTYGGGNLRMNRAYDSESGAHLKLAFRSGKQDLVSLTRSYATAVTGTVTKDSFVYFNMTKRGKSLVRDCGLDLTSGTADDVLCTYAFDYYGRTVSTYCEDGSGELLSASGGQYTVNSGVNKDNNRLLSTGSTGGYKDNGASNLITNSGFESGVGDASARVGATSVSGSSYVHSGSKALKLTGGSGVEAVYSKNTGITLTAFQAGQTTYLLSGWAKGNSVPVRDDTRTFQLTAEIKYSDGTNQYVSAPFNWQVEDEWQYVSTPVVPKKAVAVTDITVHCSYKNNVGAAYFDDIMLVKEPCATYSYDSDGKLTAANATEQEQVSYTYEGADLTSVIGTSSGTYTYEYDDSHNVTSVTNNGLTMTVGYDASGLTTSTKLTYKDGTEYMQTSAGYSADGSRVTSQTDNLGNTTTYGLTSYSSGTLRSSTTAPISDSGYLEDTVTSYDQVNSVGRPTQSYISGVASLDYAYSKGNLSSVTRGGYITGNSTKQSQSYTFTYNNFGSPLTTKVGSRTLVTNTYVNNTYLSTSTYGNGAVVSYTYDLFGRTLTKTAYGITESYTYDRYGNVGGIEITAGSTLMATIEYEYDSLGRLIETSEYNGEDTLTRRAVNEYDSHNRIINYTYYDGSIERIESYSYGSDGTVSVYTSGNSTRIINGYDRFKRLTSKNVGSVYTVDYGYKELTSTHTTTLVDEYTYTFADDSVYSYSYDYDNLGNITALYRDSTNTEARYEYDSYGQLRMETLVDEGYTVVYNYDTYGNLRSRVKYDGTTFINAADAEAINKVISTDTYTYGDSGWLDLLTAYNGKTITYDSIGNPLTYNNGSAYTMSWTGRQLDSVTKGSTTASYGYDSTGMRTSKTVGNKTSTYIYYGGRLVCYTIPSVAALYFHYDDNGNPLGFTYDGVEGIGDFYYVRNIQGDIVQIRDADGSIQANYTYDAWGKLLSVTNSSGNTITNTEHIAILNPLRYRGYVYDDETGFYYLQSRYYDPSLGRFINADSYAATGTGIIGYNMFAYCNNNPIGFSDSSGTRLIDSLSVNSETREQKDMSFTHMKAISKGILCDNLGGASEYVPSNMFDQNCYAYVLGESGVKYVGGVGAKLTDFNAETIAVVVLEDAKKDGREMRIINSCYSPIDNDEYRIAMRTNGKDDYHFMMQHNDGTWSQKFPLVSSTQLDRNSPTLIVWDGISILTVNYGNGPRSYVTHRKNYYDSATIYFAVKK